MAQSEGNDAFALGLECGHPILALEKGETKPGSAGQGRQLEVHGIRHPPATSPAEAPARHDRDDPAVDLADGAQLVGGHVEI